MTSPLRTTILAAWIGTLAFVVTGPSATAQNYAPFTAGGRQLFASMDHATTYGLAFDSIRTTGDTTSYFNFFGVSDTWVPSNCTWWGGAECMPMDRPTWAGSRIDVAADGHHRFFNVWGEAINIPFGTNALDTAQMYQDNVQRFRLSYDGMQTLSVLGQTDLVRQWTILHTDLFGTPINSPLNGGKLRVGENLGLMDFLRIDSFPQRLEPVELVGQTAPELGLNTLTPAILHDHQPGDEIQYHETYFLQGGPPWNNYDRYRKHIILSRSELADTVRYSARQEVFNAGSLDLVVDTITLSFDRSTVIATIPFERFDGTLPVLKEVQRCGLAMWSYTTFANQGLAYCTEEKCWGPYDTNGPPPMGENEDVPGLGQFHFHSYLFGPNGFSRTSDIMYFKKNGVECFNEVVMGMAPAGRTEPMFTVAPNPADGAMTIATNVPLIGADVLDIQGRTLIVSAIHDPRTTIDLSKLPTGSYVVHARCANGASASQRLLVLHE